MLRGKRSSLEVDFLSWNLKSPDEVIAQGTRKGRWEGGESLISPSVYPCSERSIFARPVVCLDPGRVPCPDCAQARTLWSSLWNQNLYVIQGSGLPLSCSHFSSLIPWQGASALTVWLHLRSLGFGVFILWDSLLFSMTRHPAKMPADLAFFLLFRCWNFQ